MLQELPSVRCAAAESADVDAWHAHGEVKDVRQLAN